MVQGFRFCRVRASGTLERRPRHRGLKGGRLKADGRLQPMPFSKDDRNECSALGAARADIVSEEEPTVTLSASPFRQGHKAMPRLSSMDRSPSRQDKPAAGRSSLPYFAQRSATPVQPFHPTFGKPLSLPSAAASIAAPSWHERARPKEMIQWPTKCSSMRPIRRKPGWSFYAATGLRNSTSNPPAAASFAATSISPKSRG